LGGQGGVGVAPGGIIQGGQGLSHPVNALNCSASIFAPFSFGLKEISGMPFWLHTASTIAQMPSTLPNDLPLAKETALLSLWRVLKSVLVAGSLP